MTLFSRSTSNRRRRYLLRPHAVALGPVADVGSHTEADSRTPADDPCILSDGGDGASPGGVLGIADNVDATRHVSASESTDSASVNPEQRSIQRSPFSPLHTPLELVLTSPDLGGLERIRIDEATFVIGSGNQSDLRCPHADVSRRHALLHRVDDRLLFADLGSRTGIAHNGQRREFGWFSAGDVLQFGPYTLRWPAAAPTGGPSSATHECAVRLPATQTPSSASGTSPDLRPVVPHIASEAPPRDLLRLFQDRSVSQLELLSRLVDSVDGKLRDDVVDEIAALKRLIEQSENTLTRSATDSSEHVAAGNDAAARRAISVRRAFGPRPRIADHRPPKLVRQPAPLTIGEHAAPLEGVATPDDASTSEMAPQPSSTAAPTADYGRIMQRMTVHRRRRTGPWRRILSLFLLG